MGQGLKTASLRLRSTKSQLVSLGEDADGAAENVSKLREQMLALTGVDIQIDETTYKSTYQVLLEISKVWGKLDDLSRSAVLEKLFGVRQSNIGAAILENGELLQQVYETAENSAGSAMREQEEYAKSIQYSIDTLKAAYQDFAQTVINSDLVKGLLGTGQSFLEIITKIIDKIGILPTVLSAIVAFKGKSIFSVLMSGSTSLIGNLSKLSQGFREVSDAYNSVEDDIIGFNKIKAGLSAGLFSESDVSSLRNYANLLKEGKTSDEAFALAMNGATEAARNQTSAINTLTQNFKQGRITEQQYSNQLTALTTQSQSATLATTALRTALNLLANVGIMIAVNLIVQGITKLAQAEEEARQKAEEARQKAVERSESYEAEAESLNELRNEYIQLASVTSNLTSEKERLLSIQEEINQAIGDQKNQVDLLNGSLEENIRLIQEQEKAEAESTIRDLQAEYDIARERLYGRSDPKYGMMHPLNTVDVVLSDDEKRFFYGLIEAYDLMAGLNLNGILLGGSDFETQLSTLEKILDLYKESDYYNTDIYNQLVSQKGVLEEQYNQYSQIVEQYENAQKVLERYNAPAEIQNMYTQAIVAYQEYQTAVESGNLEVSISAKKALESVKDIFYSVTEPNSTIREEFDALWETFELGAESAVSNIEAVQSAFDTFISDTYDSEIKNINKLKSALETTLEGGRLSHDEAWALFDIDTEGILSDIKMVNGEYELSTEQILQLTQQRIDKTKESILQIKEEAQQQLELAETTIKAEKARLAILRPNSASDVAYYQQQLTKVQEIEDEIKQVQNIIRRSDMMLDELNSSASVTVNYSKMLENETAKIDANLEAQIEEYDRQIDLINDELDALESEKDVLQDQLDILNERKSVLEDTIEDYKTAANVVQDFINEEKESVENQRSEREEYWSNIIKESEEFYNNQIDALKSEHDAKEEVNELEQKRLAIQEKELAVQEKLAALQKVGDNKVRAYSASKGWVYEVDKDALAQAQKDVADAQKNLEEAQKDYDDTLAEQLYNQKLEELEKLRDEQTELYEAQRDVELKSFDEQIESLGEYADAWADAVDSIVKSEKSLLAEQILGSNWRERIKNKDKAILSQYKSEFVSYNNQMTNLVNVEIANLQKSIEIKDKEVAAKKEQIDYWNNLKTTAQNDAAAIKKSLQEYYNSLESTSNRANTSYYQMEVSAWNAKENVSAYMNQLSANARNNADSIEDSNNRIIDSYEGVSNVLETITSKEQFLASVAASNTGGAIGRVFADLLSKLQHYDSGGVNTTTGIAWLDGTKSRPEVVLNNNDATKLYNMLHNTTANSITNPFQASALPNTVTNNSRFDGATFVFNGVQNPQQFSQQMEAWLRNESTKSKVM